MIAIIDYGMGNLRSVEKAFERVGFETVVTDKSEIIDRSEKIVLPGVGSFKDAKDGLSERNLVEPIVNHIKKGRLFLGICLGLQLLFTRSTEGGECKGLDIVAGEVVRFEPTRQRSGGKEKKEESSKSLFDENNHKLKIPHMGWNEIQIKKKVSILNGLPDHPFMYFVHSYYVIPDRNDIIATETEYGISFVSMISIENIFATQFHPEKSQRYGLTILKNFGEL
ncbi:MAG: imidazole glycerol phosphate synthase subunit HisH [Candidatus Scalinduaceae bacterium]